MIDPSLARRLRIYDGPPLAPSATAGMPGVPGYMGGLRVWLLTCVGLAVVGLTGWLDHLTGPELSLSMFYLVPVAACAWWGGFAHGILLALAGAVAWHLVDAAHHPEIAAPVGLFNGIVRFGMLVIVSSLVARLHVGIVRERLLARTDALTGAANGRTFYEAIARESERAVRAGRPLTLVYLDLDNFKQLNDKHGHAAGDEALIDLVRVIGPGLRGADVLARLGGDEFAVLLPETDASGAIALLTRMQDTLAYEMARAGRPLTVSIGAVTFLKPHWDVDVMVQQVDGLMYAAKRRGKNRVEHITIRHERDLRAGHPPRLERRATARTVCNHSARVRPEGHEGEELFATVHDLAPAGVGLRLNRNFPLGTVLIVEPLAYQAKTLLARVVRLEASEDGQWLHGCMLSPELSPDEIDCWLSGNVPGTEVPVQ
jgi:diguanylate cyclase (GGDEF)-like protein